MDGEEEALRTRVAEVEAKEAGLSLERAAAEAPLRAEHQKSLGPLQARVTELEKTLGQHQAALAELASQRRAVERSRLRMLRARLATSFAWTMSVAAAVGLQLTGRPWYEAAAPLALTALALVVPAALVRR